MSKEVRNAALKEKTKTLLEGPLKHIRGAALAAALLPLASVAAAPASAQSGCGSSGGTCVTVSGFVWNDTDNDGIQDANETGIEGAKVSICQLCDGSDAVTTETDEFGIYTFENVLDGTYTISVELSSVPGSIPSAANQTGDTQDSDGVLDMASLNVTATVDLMGLNNSDTDFGFSKSALQPPGTGTPGYWKNHPDAWPVDSITVGNVTYTKDQAIYLLGKVSKDKTTTMFSSLVSAMLNILAGNPGLCLVQVQPNTITTANAWMASYGPVGSGVPASSPEWAIGEPIHKWLDAYNNGLLCDPHRN